MVILEWQKISPQAIILIENIFFLIKTSAIGCSYFTKTLGNLIKM